MKLVNKLERGFIMWKNNKHKKLVSIVTCAICSFSLATTLVITSPATALPLAAAQNVTVDFNQVKSVESANWEPTVKKGLNDFMHTYGKNSPTYNKSTRPYAVFDFDNTTSIMDVEEQLIIWQLDHLAFAISPNKMDEVLRTGIPAEKLNLTYGANDGEGRPVSIASAINDATKAYSILYKKGLVSTNGKELSAAEKASPEFKEFSTKMRWLYDAIGETMDASVSYPWVTYWFTGMTPKEVYKLAYACDQYYGNPQKGQSWTKGKYASPADLPSQAGAVNVSYKIGVTVTPEIKELYGALKQNGIDNWICSASPIDVVKAAKDAFKIPGVKGVIAMTNKTVDGKYINQYDYDLHAQTQGVGKADSVSKVLLPKYKGQGPAFCAMDSQGDFNFCTEFKNTKAVLVVNRKRTDDAALCAGIAVWQKDHGVNLATANKKGDALFLLQGRNENIGQFWADDNTMLLGKKAKAFLSDKGKKPITQLNSGISIAQVLKADTKLKDYQGYKTR
jgi:hypothetical protein